MSTGGYHAATSEEASASAFLSTYGKSNTLGD